MSNPVRRTFIVDPQDGLLLTPTGFEAWENVYTFCQTTGLEPSNIVPSILCSAPIPRYYPRFESPRRFSKVSAKYMWHPFFWLPKHLAQRVNMPGPTGEPYVEDWDAYALRILLEMGNAGVFTPEGWLDILAPLGINVDTAEGVRRVERWQSGQPDPLLDSIDTTDLYRSPSDPMWAVKLSRMLVEPAQQAQHHLTALGFKEALSGLAPDEAIEMYGWVSSLAGIYLRDAQFPQGLKGEEFWDRMAAETRSPRFVDKGDHFLKHRGPLARKWLESLIAETEGRVEFLYAVLADDPKEVA